MFSLVYTKPWSYQMNKDGIGYTGFLCLRKPDSYTVTIYEFRGKRGLKGGGGKSCGKGPEKDPHTSIATG